MRGIGHEGSSEMGEGNTLRRQSPPERDLARHADPVVHESDARAPASAAAVRAAELFILAFDLVALAGLVLAVGAGPDTWAIAGLLGASLLATNSQRLRRNLSALADAPWLARRLALVSLIALPVLLRVADHRPGLRLVLFAPLAVLAGRALTYGVIRALRRRGRLLERALVIGSGDMSRRLVDVLEGNPKYGLTVVSVIDDVDTVDEAARSRTVARSGFGDLPALVDALSIRHVIVSPCVVHTTTPAPALRTTIERGVEVHIVPRMGEVLPQPPRGDVDVVAGYALHRAARPVPGGLQWAAKRGLDILGATTILLLAGPVLVIAALGVKLSSPGPILFRQPRVGRGGREFTMLKFRTYPVEHVDDVFSLPSSACPIPFGRFLRRTSIDELPQALNVLRGDMSLVGPRPERPHFAGPLSERVPGYADRHRVLGGITGLAQVHGYWSNSSIEERIRLDNRYIDSWSLWRDIVILLQTIPASIRKFQS